MKPVFTTVGDSLDVMILPDVKSKIDGHPILTYSYYVYKDHFNGSGEYNEKKDNAPEQEREKDPDYLGAITFVEPDKIFNYQGAAENSLDSGEVRELIEIITHYRSTPRLWAF